MGREALIGVEPVAAGAVASLFVLMIAQDPVKNKLMLWPGLCFPESGSWATQRKIGACLCREACSDSDDCGSTPEEDAMPQVRGLPAHGVWRVSLLQGHEEIRWPRQDEAVVHNETMYCGKRSSRLAALVACRRGA